MEFGFQTAASIAFGRGARGRAVEALAARAGRVLLVHGADAERSTWLRDDLRAAGVTVTAVACPAEPTVDRVTAAVALAREASVDAVVALGGGSAIDLGKAVSGLAVGTNSVLDHLEVVGKGLPLTGPSLFFVAMPTTSGTGAEVTKNAVIGVPDRGVKVSLRSPTLLPDLALVDPSLTDGAPRSVTMASGLDAVTQAIEAYVSCKASPITDAITQETIPRGLAALRTLAVREDAQARDAIAYTSLVGGMALANAGLGAVHGLAGVIGGRAGAPHGEICAALLPIVLAENLRTVGASEPAAGKLATVQAMIAEALGTQATGAFDALGAWVADVGVRSLGAMGVNAADRRAIAEGAAKASSSRGNPIPLTVEDFERILEASGV